MIFMNSVTFAVLNNVSHLTGCPRRLIAGEMFAYHCYSADFTMLLSFIGLPVIKVIYLFVIQRYKYMARDRDLSPSSFFISVMPPCQLLCYRSLLLGSLLQIIYFAMLSCCYSFLSKWDGVFGQRVVLRDCVE